MTGPAAGGQPEDSARVVTNAEVDGIGGTVVVIDVLRAFTTAAYTFGAGASEIWLVAGVGEALELATTLGGAVVMGEDGGRRPPGFDLPNSPVAASLADLDGRVVVQRTSAGTQGVVRARAAERLFAASLVSRVRDRSSGRRCWARVPDVRHHRSSRRCHGSPR